jgi:hypothetical protein
MDSLPILEVKADRITQSQLAALANLRPAFGGQYGGHVCRRFPFSGMRAQGRKTQRFIVLTMSPSAQVWRRPTKPTKLTLFLAASIGEDAPKVFRGAHGTTGYGAKWGASSGTSGEY